MREKTSERVGWVNLGKHNPDTIGSSGPEDEIPVIESIEKFIESHVDGHHAREHGKERAFEPSNG